MDTSKNTIVVATLLPGEDSPVTDRVFNEGEAIRRLVGRFPDRSVLRAWYEAGPGGYELWRLLAPSSKAVVEVGWVLTFVRDLTEQQQTQARLQELQSELVTAAE